MIYFLCIALFVRHGTFFFFVWLFLGVTALGLSFCMKRGIWQEHVPLLVRRSFWCVATIGVLFFLIVEGFILSGFGMSGSDQAKYLIVLGAQMKPDGPSKVLQYRLDAALAYLKIIRNARWLYPVDRVRMSISAKHRECTTTLSHMDWRQTESFWRISL